MSEEQSTEQLSYEQAFAELENIIQALEEDGSSLEESIALFERGQALAKRCAALLDGAELRVRQLTEQELIDQDDEDY
jgi:exodeoxyribonuclease VII small subunit